MLALGLLVVAGVIVYLNSFSGVFLFDDKHSIVENSRIRDFDFIWRFLWFRRGLVELSFAVNYAFGKLDVWGYHAFNLCVHVLAGFALFGVVRRTLLREAFRESYHRAATGIAFTVALLWLVHPLQTQCVTYIVQRAESMMGLFYLVTLYCLVRGVDSSRRPLWYAAAVASCALGMNCKAVMITAPVVVFLYDLVFVGKSFTKTLKLRWGLYVGLVGTWGILVVSGIVRGVLAPSVGTRSRVGFAYKGVTPFEYLISQPGVILRYLKLSFWPKSLCLDYWWLVAEAATAIIVPGLVVMALLVGTLWAFWRKPWLGFLGAWFFLILSPTSSFIPIRDLAFEHRMYLPLAAVVVLAVITGRAVLGYLSVRLSLKSQSPRLIAGILVVLVGAGLGWGTVRRNRDYHSKQAMWSDVVHKRPENSRAYNNLGMALIGLGKTQEAIARWNKALELEPNYLEAHNNLGKAYHQQGKTTDAIKHFTEILRLAPDSAIAHNSLGDALVGLGEIDEGIVHLRKALSLKPRFAKAHNNLGMALGRQGKFDKAAECLATALRYDPDNPNAHSNLGNVLAAQGELDQAIEHYTTALRLQPDHIDARCNLATAFTQQGKLAEAIEQYRTVLRLNPNHTKARKELNKLLQKKGAS
ncbi:MAG: tetratricopeptide repeat protein [Phycisphaerae bacterium]|nr:tetratricopeptide repeat protein [Phycisphaerae bacterium]